jgi:2-dehydro-3-deoxyphosphooctonate aldolase (KDO 8-P synthase)
MKNVKKIKIGDINVGGDLPLFLIAGPCVIESEKSAFKIAEKLVAITNKLKVPLVFKASYDKANRTSIKSFRGPGIVEGLKILNKIKKEFQFPILTDVHCSYDVDLVSTVADIVQIPAFLCRQTDLLLAVAKKAKCINVKKGQFLAPWDMKNVIEKIERGGNKNILISERGTSFGYNQLVVDICSLPIMRGFGYPVIFDVTHSLQMPGGLGSATGGRGEFIDYLASAATAAGIDGMFIEVHPDPKKALSDASNSLKLDYLPELLEKILAIDKIVKKI